MQNFEQLSACWEISPFNQQIIPNNDSWIHMMSASTTQTCLHTSMNNPIKWAVRHLFIVKDEFWSNT